MQPNAASGRVAAGFPVSIGADTSASVQHLSANCSVVGFIGTQGLVSRVGIIPRGATQDHPGPMRREKFDE